MDIRRKKVWIITFILYALAAIAIPRLYLHMTLAGWLPFIPPPVVMPVGKAVSLIFLLPPAILSLLYFRKLNPDEKTVWIAMLIALAVFCFRAYAFFDSFEAVPAKKSSAQTLKE